MKSYASLSREAGEGGEGVRVPPRYTRDGPVDVAVAPSDGANMRVAAILVAAGSGSRFGADVAKQFLPLAGKLVIRHAAEALAAHVDLLQPVGDAAAIAASLAGLPHLTTVAGGATRQDSVRAGLEALAPHAPDLVLGTRRCPPADPARHHPSPVGGAATFGWRDPRRARRGYA